MNILIILAVKPCTESLGIIFKIGKRLAFYLFSLVPGESRLVCKLLCVGLHQNFEIGDLSERLIQRVIFIFHYPYLSFSRLILMRTGVLILTPPGVSRNPCFSLPARTPFGMIYMNYFMVNQNESQ